MNPLDSASGRAFPSAPPPSPHAAAPHAPGSGSGAAPDDAELAPRADPAADSPAHALRGLASADESAALAVGADHAPRASLWSRIKRAFQYGSQGGDPG